MYIANQKRASHLLNPGKKAQKLKKSRLNREIKHEAMEEIYR